MGKQYKPHSIHKRQDLISASSVLSHGYSVHQTNNACNVKLCECGRPNCCISFCRLLPNNKRTDMCIISLEPTSRTGVWGR